MYKKIIIVMLIVLGAFTTFFLYRTYAYDTSVVEDTPTTTDKAYTFKIGNSSIKQIKLETGETKYFDIVLSNPNNAKISYSIYYEMVSPTTKPDDFSIGYTSKSTGDSTGKVDKNGSITLTMEVSNTSSSAVTVKIGTVAGYVNGGELTLNSGQVVIPKRVFPDIATEYVKSLDIGSTGDSGSGVYKVEHSLIPASSSATGSDIPAVTDYRYYGASPNNYICLDKGTSSTCPDKHLYRIIGSIYEEKENTNRIKVIKATPLTDGTTKGFSWDYKVNNGSGSYDNIWATITSGNYSNSLTSGSQLMKLLNSGLWWNGTSGSYYNGSTTATNVNFTNYKLSAKAKSYITTSRYYLGGYNNSQGVMTNQFYTYERGTTRYNTNRPLYWDGMVGLMYPSDYGYAAGNTCVTGTDPYNYDGGCKNKDWLWMTTSSDYSNSAEWFMSPDSGSSFNAFLVSSSGLVNGGYVVINVRSARPVFYLTSTTSITDGTGTSTDPYILS